MKNLLERLKPEILQEMENRYNVYPLVIKELKNELENLYYVNDIRYQFIIQLESMHLAAFNEFPKNGWEHFNNN